MHFFPLGGARKRYFKPGKAGSIALSLLLSLALSACGGGGSGGATGGFADVDSDKSPASLEAVTLAPIGTIQSTNPGVPWGNVLRFFGDPAFKLNGPSYVSGPFVFSSANTDVATIAGDMVTIVGAGTAYITANSTSGGASQTMKLTVNKGNPRLSMPTVTIEALGVEAKLQASTKSTGAIKYALSNMMPSGGDFQVAYLGVDGRTIGSGIAGTATITATQVPTANYEGGTVSGKLIVEKKKLDIGLSDLTQVFTGLLQITPTGVPIRDELSGEERTPIITTSNTDFAGAWDASNFWIRLGAARPGSTKLTLSLAATSNLAAVSKTVTITLTETTGAQPGRQLTSVSGYSNAYKSDYQFDSQTKEVTLKLCPPSETVEFTFTESDNNFGKKHVFLENVGELTRDINTGIHVGNIPAIATGDKPLRLISYVDAFNDNSGVPLNTSDVYEYLVNVEVLVPKDNYKCYTAGPT
jgi:hypothetical protein